MIIGIPTEIKAHENRVSLLPAGAAKLAGLGHQIFIEKGAGRGSGITDERFREAGANIVDSADDLWERAEMIMKVKEPVKIEYSRMKEGQIIFTYFHFAASRPLTEAVIKSKCIAIAYETVQKLDGSLPLLVPMSEAAGRMAVQEGAKYLEKPQGGKGILLAGIPGVKPANTIILGGGIVGVNAAKIAAGMGAHTTIMDIDIQRLRYLDSVMPKNVATLFSSEANIREMLPRADMVIGSVLKPGAKAPHLITKDMLSILQKGSVLIDVAIDQGGCFETSQPTTHDDPVYEVEGVVHYCVSNMPGAIPYTSSRGLTNATLPYAVDLANKGWKKALDDDDELKKGFNIVEGKIVYQEVAEAFDMKHITIESII